MEISEEELDALLRDWEHGDGRDGTDHLVHPALVELKELRKEIKDLEYYLPTV